MSPTARRVLAALLVLGGLVLAVPGAWLVAHLGTSGTATFRAPVDRPGPVVLGPDVLNRVDFPVTVSASAADGTRVWLGVATPSDTRRALARGGGTAVTGVAVEDWSLATAERPGGVAGPLSGLDVWSARTAGEGSASVTVQQDEAPQSVVVTAPGDARIAAVEATWSRGAWFLQAAVVAAVGLLLLVVGASAAWSTRRPSEAPGEGAP